MVKVIDIEYCGGWGFGGPAQRLQKALKQAYPDLEVNIHSANGRTSLIEVAILDGDKKQMIWSKGKADT